MNDYDQIICNEQELSGSAIFVVGPPRSGTSMLARILSLPNQAIYLGETGLFHNCLWQIVPWRLLVRKKDKLKYLDITKQSFSLAMIRRSYSLLFKKERLKKTVEKAVRFTLIPHSTNLRKLREIHNKGGIVLERQENDLVKKLCHKYQNYSASPKKFVSIFMEDMRLLGNAEIVIEKTPGHLFFLNAIYHCLPDAGIAGIYRQSSSDCLASYFAMTKDLKQTKALASSLPERHRLVKGIEKHETGPSCTVKYEDIIDDPANMTEKIYNIFGLPFTTDIINAIKDIKPQPSKYEMLSAKERRKLDKIIRC